MRVAIVVAPRDDPFRFAAKSESVPRGSFGYVSGSIVIDAQSPPWGTFPPMRMSNVPAGGAGTPWPCSSTYEPSASW